MGEPIGLSFVLTTNCFGVVYHVCKIEIRGLLGNCFPFFLFKPSRLAFPHPYPVQSFGPVLLFSHPKRYLVGFPSGLEVYSACCSGLLSAEKFVYGMYTKQVVGGCQPLFNTNLKNW